MEKNSKGYHYDKVQQVSEPLPVADEKKPDFDGWSVLITSVSGLVMAVATLIGAVKGRRYIQNRRAAKNSCET